MESFPCLFTKKSPARSALENGKSEKALLIHGRRKGFMHEGRKQSFHLLGTLEEGPPTLRRAILLCAVSAPDAPPLGVSVAQSGRELFVLPKSGAALIRQPPVCTISVVHARGLRSSRGACDIGSLDIAKRRIGGEKAIIHGAETVGVSSERAFHRSSFLCNGNNCV